MTGSDHSFRRVLSEGRLPAPAVAAPLGDVSAHDLADLFESQLLSRHLDLAARRLAREGRAFYSIGSAGHEGNAAIARALRLTDMAFLHYRSGAFLLERSRQKPGATTLWDMALSFVASAEDPCSGGRHKVLGSKDLFVPPQTSTIASHVPKAVGAAFAVTLARTLKKEDAPLPWDSVILCSFGDASANHSTALGAFNTAQLMVRRGLKMPIVFVCEDNGLGISVPTPEDWIADAFSARPHLHYIAADGRDVRDVYGAAREAASHARQRRTPVFLHVRTLRLMGHAGSDVESVYRDRAAIEADEAEDPLLHSARLLMEAGVASQEELLAWDAETAARVARVMDEAATRAKLTDAAAIAAPIAPAATGRWRESRRGTLGAETAAPAAASPGEPGEPVHLSRMVSQTLADLMAEDPSIVVFGEDVAAKGGVYGATMGLLKAFGPSRVFDTPLDEQSVLGAALGLAHNGFVPIPEIQFLAYVHNAEDQIRGEAATLSFFSQSQFANPMVIRVAGLGYQRGFGGHFHNDNALGVFRDIPGVIVACPSSAREAALMLRECVRLARDEGRVVVFLEPIALYPMKDLYEEGDGLMLSARPLGERIAFGEPGVHDDAAMGPVVDVAVLTYGNGVRMARRVARRLVREHALATRVVDARWLTPFAGEPLLAAADGARALVILDECRRSGSWSEAVVTAVAEAGDHRPVARVTAADSFIPLGPAATAVLPSEDELAAAVLRAAAQTRGAVAPARVVPASGEAAGADERRVSAAVDREPPAVLRPAIAPPRSAGEDAPGRQATDETPLGSDPQRLVPLGSDPQRLEPQRLEPQRLEPLGLEPLGLEPPVEPLSLEPPAPDDDRRRATGASAKLDAPAEAAARAEPEAASTPPVSLRDSVSPFAAGDAERAEPVETPAREDAPDETSTPVAAPTDPAVSADDAAAPQAAPVSTPEPTRDLEPPLTADDETPIWSAARPPAPAASPLASSDVAASRDMVDASPVTHAVAPEDDRAEPASPSPDGDPSDPETREPGATSAVPQTAAPEPPAPEPVSQEPVSQGRAPSGAQRAHKPLIDAPDGAYRFKDIGALAVERDAAGAVVEVRFPENDGRELHAYGDGPFCRFDIRRRDRRGGVFVILEDDVVVFVDRTKNLDERFGYGRRPGYRAISAQMCWPDGPAGLCRINTLILKSAKAGKTLSVRFAPASDCTIPVRQVEERLTEEHDPVWGTRADTRARWTS